MENNLRTFENPEFGKLTVIEKDGEFSFIGKEVAEKLGYSNTRKAILDHVDSEDKAAVTIRDGRQRRNMVSINESGLYSLILSSKLSQAKEFKRWVTKEVLPSIRKNGGYIKNQENMSNEEILVRGMLAAKNIILEKNKVIENLGSQVTTQQKQITEMTPKVQYYDLVMNSKSLTPISVIAKDYGMTAQMFNSLLHKEGIQYKKGHIWLLYKKHADKGYTSTKTFHYNKFTNDVIAYTCWTQRGRLFIYETLKEKGILAMIEKQERE